MSIGIIMVMIQTYFQLRFKFRNINDLRFSEPKDVQELRREIAMWQRAAASLSSYSKVKICSSATSKSFTWSFFLGWRCGAWNTFEKSETIEASAESKACLRINASRMLQSDFTRVASKISDQEQMFVGSNIDHDGVCHQLLLHALGPRLAKIVIGLDSLARCNLAVDFIRSRRHGSNSGANWVVNSDVLRCSVCIDGSIDMSRSYWLDRSSNGKCHFNRWRRIAARCCNINNPLGLGSC